MMHSRYSEGLTDARPVLREAFDRAVSQQMSAYLTREDAWFFSAYDRQWFLEGPR